MPTKYSPSGVMVTRVTGRALVCWELRGSRTLRALGTTSVLETMKKIRSRKMTSVIDAMLKSPIAFDLRLSFISVFLPFVQK